MTTILLIFFFIIPYCQPFWWKFIIALPFILLITHYKYPYKTLEQAGLNIPLKQLCISCGIFLIFFLLSHFYINIIIVQKDILFYPNPPIWILTIIFQVFNEEIVTRALLLNFLKTKIKKNITCAIVAALSFAILHFLLYYPVAKIILNPQALLAIFLFGLICNFLFLKFKHIGFGLAMHLGWNIVRFSGVYFKNNMMIPEGQLFNMFEGTWSIIFFLIALITLGHFIKHKT